MPINELRAIATFAKAIELGSLRRAAAAQGVTPQAASRTVQQLEQHLGVRLMHRTTRHLALTEEGREFIEATQPALASLDRAMHRVRSTKDELAGPLRIVGPYSSFAPVIWPVIDEFCRTLPDVKPDVQLNDGIGNWVQDRVDVGFRIGTSPEQGVIGRRLFPLQLIICAAPSYIERHGAPRSLGELATHRCSVFRHPETGRVIPWHVKVGDEIQDIAVAPALSTNHVDLELHAALSGQVVAQIAAMSAAEHFRAGRLVPLLTEHMADHAGLHMYYGSRTSQPARVRRFIDLAIERLTNPPEFVLTAKEIAAGRRAAQRSR